MTTAQKAVRTDVPRAEVIARLNDQLRTTGTGGTIMITQNVKRITGFDAAVLTKTLAEYSHFDADNEHHERDFGAMTLWGWDLLFKVDYYCPSLKFASEDPADPQKTHRVLTVMLASDW